MKTWFINMIGKLGGFGKLWDKVSGYKTYAGGYAAILTGAAHILTEIAAINDLAGLLEFVKQLPNDSGWLAILGGLVAVGLRHAQAKAAPVQP